MNDETLSWLDSVALYDEMAQSYDAIFEEQTYRRAYDLLAGEYVGRVLPATRGLIVDAGCGTGRWAARWLALGHSVIGIEQAPRMAALARRKALGPSFRLIEASMTEAEIEESTADLVVAMGSIQYLADPAAAMSRFVRWLKPGGRVCVYTDSSCRSSLNSSGWVSLRRLCCGSPRAEANFVLATSPQNFTCSTERV